jgi:hypothetical protein
MISLIRLPSLICNNHTIHLICWQHVHIYKLSWYDWLKETVAIMEWSVALLLSDDTQTCNLLIGNVQKLSCACNVYIIHGFVLFPCLRAAYDFLAGGWVVVVLYRSLHVGWAMISSDTSLSRHVYVSILPTPPWMFCSILTVLPCPPPHIFLHSIYILVRKRGHTY